MMAIQIRQESSPAKGKRWNWALWLEGPPAELDAISQVVFELHPTFADPIRKVDDRASGFRLEGSAWGEFMVHLTLAHKDGTRDSREHWLRLGPDAPSKIAEALNLSTKGNSPTVFLSASMADAALTSGVKDALRRQGIQVISQDDLAVGSAWNSELHSMIQSADVGVAVISKDPSPWVVREVAELRDQHTPVIPLLLGDDSDLPQAMQDLQALRVDEGESPDAVAGRVIDLMPRANE